MRTVKEVSQRTGISVRTLHYYDQIGLLKPTAFSEAGYRLYDDKALETLRQILFFREFDLPLKEIQAILENPDFDRNQILKTQKKMLELKRDRLDRLIDSIDGILKGEEKMDFTVFSTEDIREICQSTFANMSKEVQEMAVKQYGGEEEYLKFLQKEMSTEQAQKNMAKMVEWYGGKENYMDVATHPQSAQVMEAYGKRVGAVHTKLFQKKGTDVASFEVKELVGELEFVLKQLLRFRDMRGYMLECAKGYRENAKLRKLLEETHGEGSADYLADAIEAFYQT